MAPKYIIYNVFERYKSTAQSGVLNVLILENAQSTSVIVVHVIR